MWATCIYPNKKTWNQKSTNCKDYLVKFEMAADWNKLDEEEKVEALRMRLEGDAAAYMHGLRGFCNYCYEELCEVLDDRFGAAQTITKDKRLLGACQQDIPESYTHLAQDRRWLVR